MRRTKNEIAGLWFALTDIQRRALKVLVAREGWTSRHEVKRTLSLTSAPAASLMHLTRIGFAERRQSPNSTDDEFRATEDGRTAVTTLGNVQSRSMGLLPPKKP